MPANLSTASRVLVTGTRMRITAARKGWKGFEGVYPPGEYLSPTDISIIHSILSQLKTTLFTPSNPSGWLNYQEISAKWAG